VEGEGSAGMPGSEYECRECCYQFRTPPGVPVDTRSLMCPACGSIYLDLADAAPAPAAVWTARPATSTRPDGEREGLSW
jgi:hypothetical protein